MVTASLSPPTKADPKYIARGLRVFIPDGATFEIRGIGVDGRKKTASGLYRDFDKAARDIINLENRKTAGIYFVLNAINPDLFARSPDMMTDFPDHTTADKDIIRRHWLLMDVDPDRPAGLSSTAEELEASIHLAADLRNWLTERMGFLEPIECISSNGVHHHYPIDLPNDDRSTQLVKSVLEVARDKAEELQSPDRPICKVDTSVFNAARICKVYGVVSRKGGDIPERPHRRSYIEHVPEHLGTWEASR